MMISFKSVLRKGALFIILCELLSLSEAKAQTVIDTTPVTTPFSFFPYITCEGCEVDAEANAPTPFDTLLGPIENVSLKVSGQFNWPSGNTAGNIVKSSTETITFTMNVGDYLPGAGSLTTQFPVVASCPNDVCSEVQVPSVTIPFSFPTINSDKAPTDMPIPLISSNSISGQGAFSGIFKISGKVTVDIKYDELTDSTYVQEALDHVAGTGPSKGSVMLQLITELRNNDPGTSSTNLNLRDAQYALYGYNAGALLGSGSSLQAVYKSLATYQGNATGQGYGGPFATLGWNTIKVLAQTKLCPACQQFIDQSVNPNLPGTSADLGAGLDANTIGFLEGLFHPNDPSGLPAALADNVVPLPVQAGTLLLPVIDTNLDPGGTTRFSLFLLDSTVGSSVLLDPKLAKTFAFGAIGADFSGIELPLIPGTEDISSAMLTVNGISVTINGNTWYDFKDLFGFDPSTIIISDLTGAELPQDPEFAFRFDANGLVALADVESNNVAQAVPEIPTWLMAFAGFAALGFAGGRARRSAALLQH
jgi:hypothetical protein